MLQLFADLRLRWKIAPLRSLPAAPPASSNMPGMQAIHQTGNASTRLTNHHPARRSVLSSTTAGQIPGDKPSSAPAQHSATGEILRLNRRSFTWLFRLLVTLLVAITTCAHANQSPQRLTLATVDNFPPFSYMDSGRLTGIDIDLVHEMARRLDISVRLQTHPWARVMSSVRSGEVDGAFSAFETEERQAFCLYVGVLHVEEFYLFTRKGNEFLYSQISDLYGKRVGIDRGVYVSEAFKQAVDAGRITLEEVNDMGMINIRKLNAGRINAAIGDLGVVKYYLKLLGLEQRVVPLQPIREPAPTYLVLSKKSTLENKTELQHRMRETLHGMWEDGTYHAIYDRHVNKLAAQPPAR